MLPGKRVFSVAAALALAGALALGGATLADATTGNTNGFPEPKAVVPVPVANPFTGRYVVQAVGRGAKIRSGEMKIDYSESQASPQFLVGPVELYAYNGEGRVVINLLTLYPFRVVQGGVSAVMLGQAIAETYKLGSMKLFTPTNGREVRGEVTFAGQGTYPIVLRRLAPGENPNGNPPLAKQLGSGSEPAGSGATTSPGSDPGKNAGVLAPLVRAVQGLSG